VGGGKVERYTRREEAELMSDVKRRRLEKIREKKKGSVVVVVNTLRAMFNSLLICFGESSSRKGDPGLGVGTI